MCLKLLDYFCWEEATIRFFLSFDKMISGLDQWFVLINGWSVREINWKSSLYSCSEVLWSDQIGFENCKLSDDKGVEINIRTISQWREMKSVWRTIVDDDAQLLMMHNCCWWCTIHALLVKGTFAVYYSCSSSITIMWQRRQKTDQN